MNAQAGVGPPPGISANNQAGGGQAPAGDLASISLTAKLPEFWTEMPRLWFAQFEAVMAPQKQGDETKFNMVVAKLTREALQQVSDLLITPPETQKYDAIKKRLLTVFEESAERQFQKLLGGMELGSQRPSHLLRRMKDLARTADISDEALRKLWMARLPASVRAVLTVSEDKKLENLAAIADKIIENMQTEVAEVTSEKSASMELMAQVAQLTMQVGQLRGEISEIRTQRGRSPSRRYDGGRWRPAGRSQSRGPRRTTDSPDWLCRFHYRYQERARDCERPCNWKGKGRQAEN